MCQQSFNREPNTIADCPIKKGFSIFDWNVYWSNFRKDVINISFHDYCVLFPIMLFDNLLSQKKKWSYEGIIENIMFIYIFHFLLFFIKKNCKENTRLGN